MAEPADPQSLFSLAGRVAVVTGAAGGIGAAVAVGLARFGAAVACFDLAGADLDATRQQIESSGGAAVVHEVDVTDGDAVQAAVEAVGRELGPVSAAVNAAGINFQQAAESMTTEQWRRLLDVNLTGVFHSCRAQGAAMLAHGQGGSIVNIGSISATIANRGLDQVHYNSAKAGVLQLTKSLALEWAEQGIRVNSVSPGYTATPMARDPAVWEHVKEYEADIPLKRMAEPSELVGPIVFLLSRAASYTTGIDLLVDGGATSW